MTMSTIVFIDTRGEKLPKAAQEAVTYASKLAGGPVTAVTFGTAHGLEALGANGASKGWRLPVVSSVPHSAPKAGASVMPEWVTHR